MAATRRRGWGVVDVVVLLVVVGVAAWFGLNVLLARMQRPEGEQSFSTGAELPVEMQAGESVAAYLRRGSTLAIGLGVEESEVTCRAEGPGASGPENSGPEDDPNAPEVSSRPETRLLDGWNEFDRIIQVTATAAGTHVIRCDLEPILTELAPASSRDVEAELVLADPSGSVRSWVSPKRSLLLLFQVAMVMGIVWIVGTALTRRTR